MRRADSSTARGLGSRLPGGAGFGQKASSWSRVLSQQLITSVAVDSNGRGAEECLGRMLQAGKQVGQLPGGLDAALRNLTLIGGCPSVGAQVGSGQVDNIGKLLKPSAFPQGWKGNFQVAGRLAAHQFVYCRPACCQTSGKRRTNQPGSAADEDLHFLHFHYHQMTFFRQYGGTTLLRFRFTGS